MLRKNIVLLSAALVFLFAANSTINAQTVDVQTEFTVDMTDLVTVGQFQPGEDNLYVVGSFNDWSTEKESLTQVQLSQLTDDIGPYTQYRLHKTITIDLNVEFIEFKFIYVRFDNQNWEVIENRMLEVNFTGITGENLVFKFNDHIPFSYHTITFEVNLSDALAVDYFQPHLGDIVVVNGPFNDWGSTTEMAEVVGTENYTVTQEILASEFGGHEYKYRILTGDGRTIEKDGWEVFADDFGNPDPLLNRYGYVEERGSFITYSDSFSVPFTSPGGAISHAKTMDFGQIVDVTGIITTPNFGNPNAFAQFYMQDETAGIKVYIDLNLHSDIADSLIQPTSLIRVVGPLGVFADELQIQGEFIEIIEVNIGIPEPIIIADRSDWDISSPLAGMRVQINDVHLQNSDQWPTMSSTGAYNIDATKNNEPFLIRLDSRGSELVPSPIPSQPFNVSGVMGSFMSVPQLMPFFSFDIMEGDSTLLQRSVTFHVDMHQAVDEGYFDGMRGDQVFVRGTFNDWSTHPAPMMRDLEDPKGGIDYKITLNIAGDEYERMEYKYYIQTYDGREILNNGWEQIPDEYGGSDGNREFYLGAANQDMYIGPDYFSILDQHYHEWIPIELFNSDYAVSEGQTFYSDVVIGDPYNPAVNLYGVGTEIHYNSGAFHLDSLVRGSLFEGFDDQVIEFMQESDDMGIVYLSYTLTDNNLTLPEFGQVARAYFSVRPGAEVGGYWIGLHSSEAIDNIGGYFYLHEMGDHIDIMGDGLLPGDTNLDGIVDAFDIEPLSTWFGYHGPHRDQQSIQWESQQFYLWYHEPATFADTNGDGIVNQNDLLAIGFNFGKTTPDYAVEKLASIRELPILAEIAPLQKGDIIQFEVQIGSDQNNIEAIRSLSLNLRFDHEMMQLRQVEVAEWFRSPQMLQFNRYDHNRNIQSMAMARLRNEGEVLVESSVMILEFEMLTNTTHVQHVELEKLNINHADGKYYHPEISFNEIGITSINPREHPTHVVLMQNYPNPFNPVTQIRYTLPGTTDITLEVYNLMGQKVTTLFNGVQHAGRHSASFDGTNLSSGMYIYRLTTKETTLSRPMMLIK